MGPKRCVGNISCSWNVPNCDRRVQRWRHRCCIGGHLRRMGFVLRLYARWTGMRTLWYSCKQRGNFGFDPSDVVESTVAAFTAAIDALTGDSDDAESILEDSYMAIEMGFLKTYMRAAIRYANKMDSDAEADDGLNLRVNQLEGYAFANAILPYAATFDEEAAANIAAAFEPTMYAPVGEDNSVDLSAYTETLPVVLENVEAIMAAAGVDDDAFGVLSS